MAEPKAAISVSLPMSTIARIHDAIARIKKQSGSQAVTVSGLIDTLLSPSLTDLESELDAIERKVDAGSSDHE